MRAALLGLAAALAPLLAAGEAASRSIHVYPGVARPGPPGGWGPHRPFGGHPHPRFPRVYPFGYGPLPALYAPFGYGTPAGYGAERVIERAAPSRPALPESIGIDPQPVGVPTLTVIGRDPRTGRSRAMVYEVGPGAAPPALMGPRIVRVRGGR